MYSRFRKKNRVYVTLVLQPVAFSMTSGAINQRSGKEGATRVEKTDDPSELSGLYNQY